MRNTLPRIGYSNAGFQTAPLLKAGGRRLVTYNDQGEIEGVKYDRLTAVLANAVQELAERERLLTEENEALKRESTALKNESSALKSESAALKARLDALEARFASLSRRERD